MNEPVAFSITIGAALSLALTPVWIASARGFFGASVLGSLVVAALVASPMVTRWMGMTHQTSSHEFRAQMVFLMGAAASVGALLWCRTVLPTGVVAALYGVGMFAATALHPNPLLATNVWRWGFAMPTTVLLLALAMLAGKRWFELLAVVLLAMSNALAGGRSDSGILLMVAVILAWQHRPRFSHRSSSAITAVALVGMLAYGAYRALSGAALEGYLGEAAQDRTQAQIALSGSLILGGRPEIGATVELLRTNPIGFGPGTVPAPADILVAKTGMSRLGYDPDNGYVERYMLGQGKFELHSLVGDFWAAYSIVGLLLVIAIAVLVLHYLGLGLASSTGSAIGFFLALRTLWDIGFSPIVSSIDQLILAVAVLLLPAVRGHRSFLSGTTNGDIHRRPTPMRRG
ncbi:hypothetical protein SAMN04487968_10510 [Nocardioides terrae]|uniref:O-antigen ligase n=1 Tax=Nocardioides terrae TaxID=574651 RepID=A0A1I1HU03_9ACTN|nr:hypothetical protein [Nocardioides terrae]SFC27341.1 hypothetical protein SAMN04487968_10510 [Nocardioides terrae]